MDGTKIPKIFNEKFPKFSIKTLFCAALGCSENW